jgi:acyl-CoA thioesterase FadM
MDASVRFEGHYRVRFDEAAANGSLRPSGLVRFAQDLAWRHSDAAGFGREWYAERETAWLVRRVWLRIHAAVTYGDVVVGSTGIVGWRRVTARRRTHFRASDERPIADIDTDWVLLTRAGRPTRIPDEIARYFAPGADFRAERLVLPAAPPDAATSEVIIRAMDVDPMGHLNNAVYLDLADEAAARPQGEHSTSYQLEYLRPAIEGARLRLTTWAGREGEIACRMSDAKGLEYCHILLGTGQGTS